MIQIRAGTFETNSSSTHSICISKQQVDVSKLPSRVYFDLDHYGWEHACVEDTCAYLYSAIMDLYDRELGEKCLQRLKDVLQKYNIEATFAEPTKDRYGYTSYGIDHCDELYSFLDKITQDEDMLLRFLFNPASCIYTGNDNSYGDEDMCRCAVPRIFDEETWKMTDNPRYDPEHFDYEYKSN